MYVTLCKDVTVTTKELTIIDGDGITQRTARIQEQQSQKELKRYMYARLVCMHDPHRALCARNRKKEKKETPTIEGHSRSPVLLLLEISMMLSSYQSYHVLYTNMTIAIAF